ncbi:MAG: hypothetical protein OXG81_13840 [Acidobacteria bacterium]|nr:hypothetical protein [Acidobacteriota bacterium]
MSTPQWPRRPRPSPGWPPARTATKPSGRGRGGPDRSATVCRRERKRADLNGRARPDRPVAPADREPAAEPEPTPGRRDATGWTTCPDCAGKLAAQLSILPAPEHLVRCLDCGAEYVARSKPA